jgi:hypothetical protein
MEHKKRNLLAFLNCDFYRARPVFKILRGSKCCVALGSKRSIVIVEFALSILFAPLRRAANTCAAHASFGHGDKMGRRETVSSPVRRIAPCIAVLNE